MKASYLHDALFEEHLHGRDAFLYQMYQNARGSSVNTACHSMVDRTYRPSVLDTEPTQRKLDSPHAQVTTATHYATPASGVSGTLYRMPSPKTGAIMRKNPEGPLTDSLIVVSWRASSLGLRYQWDGKHRLAKISIQQKQSIGEGSVFDVAVKLRFRYGDRPWIVRSRSTKRTRFYVLSHTLLKCDSIRIMPPGSHRFQKPNPLWLTQLEDDSDMMGRLMAVEAPESKSKASPALTKRWEPFHGVRIKAAKALGHMRTNAEGTIELGPANRRRVRLAVPLEFPIITTPARWNLQKPRWKRIQSLDYPASHSSHGRLWE